MAKPVSANYRPAFSVAMGLVNMAAEMRGVEAYRVARRERTYAISHTRFGVIWVMRQLGIHYERIRDVLHFKDHTSVIHAFRQAEKMRASDEAFRAFTDNLYVWALMQEPLVERQAAA